ncbi:uncharacterized protein LOC128952837 [Oppia nitens]|uniref:uncharacterized protein LOC128952837 n=1 Tax=Oppia nitens TaxID=1686743 RepID=UPI0023D9F7E4|nr:uncharacterized protein LOC128952837 [Oppia nitens]
MYSNQNILSTFVIILSVLDVYTKDSHLIGKNNSDLSVGKSYTNSTKNSNTIINSDVDNSDDEVKSKYKSKQFSSDHTLTGQWAGRQTATNFAGIGNSNDYFSNFWYSLYVDRSFNSSFALNVPLFTITVPGYGRGLKYATPLSAINVGNLAVLGMIFFGSIALWLPIVFPDVSTKRSLDSSDISSIPYILAKRIINISERMMGRSMNNEEKQGLSNFVTSRLVGVSESIMGWVEKSVDDLPNFPRLDAQECMKRCICEAHNQPKKYGLTGLVLQLFFPPYTEIEEPLKVVSKYQLAARYGRQDNANCAAQYDGCLVNFLDIVQGLINLVF